MKGDFPIRADLSILAVLFVMGLCAAFPAGVLYWLMLPTIVPNPGTSSYRPPRPDPTFPLIARETRDPYALSIAAAKRANELLPAEAGSALASARDAENAPKVSASTTIRQPKRQRIARTQGRQQTAQQPATPLQSWAIRDHAFATWYR